MLTDTTVEKKKQSKERGAKMTEQEKAKLRSEYPNAMPIDVAAHIIGTTNRRLRIAISNGYLQGIVVDLSDGAGSKHYKIITERFIAHLEAEDMKQRLQNTDTEQVIGEIASKVIGKVFKELSV